MNFDVAARSPTSVAMVENPMPRARTGRRADRLWGMMQTPAAKPQAAPQDRDQRTKEAWERAPQTRHERTGLRRNQLRSIVAQADHMPARDLTLVHEHAHLQPSKTWYPNRVHSPQTPPPERLPPAVDARPETPRTILRAQPQAHKPAPTARRRPTDLSPS
jgi:hypothetical protein